MAAHHISHHAPQEPGNHFKQVSAHILVRRESFEGTQYMARAVAIDWDCLLEYIDDDLVNVQAFRAVCRDCVTEAAAQTLCHLAFHEKADIMLDPFSDRRQPIWMRCFALYSHGYD